MMPGGPNGHPGLPHHGRRHENYHYPPQYPQHVPYHPAYAMPPPQFYTPPPPPHHQQQHYAAQWYPHPYQAQYMPQPPPPPPHQHRQYPPQPAMVPHYQNSGITYSHPPNMSSPRPARTPQPQFEQTPTPSTSTQPPQTSPSTTPTTASAHTPTPPVQVAKALAAQSSSTASTQLPTPNPFHPPLPWYSVPESDFPARLPHRRRKRRALVQTVLELPSRGVTVTEVAEPDIPEEPPGAPTPTEHPPPDDISSPSEKPDKSQQHKSAARPLAPVIPALPRQAPKGDKTAEAADVQTTQAALVPDQETESATDVDSEAAVPAPIPKPPSSWAALLRSKVPAASLNAPTGPSTSSISNGLSVPKAATLVDALRSYDVNHDSKLSFLEPRGLVNTGNMCYMNSILQILAYCTPFYEFLDQVGKQAVHSFKSDTPLIDAMIMFMREFNIIDSATSAEQLRLRLKDNELEQYGDPFIPEFVYEVINRLPRFSTMRRGHQQDAEEFLGFLLEGLHDECARVMKLSPTGSSVASDSPESSVADGTTESAAGGDGWLEVGPKQKAAVTRSSGAIATESPVTKIFGGKLRSEFRVPGLKNSVTLEPYQPLQLDIGDPKVFNITDALKGLTRSEQIHGEFNSPRGPGATATKQVFIETLPPVLILHLKRFHYDHAGGPQKIWKKVGYPLDLEIPKEVFPQSKRAQLGMRPGGLPRYRLTGVVYHHGKNASGGHYTVDVRRQDGVEWIRLDDTLIRRVRAEDVAKEGGEEDPKALAAALENHKRDTSMGGNIYKAAGFDGDSDNETDDDRGWSQVNGGATSPAANKDANAKKWSGIVNGTSTGGTATPSTAGKQTPKESSTRFSVKDNKVAYILFYERIRS